MFSLVFRKRLKGTVQQDFQPPFFHHFNLPGPLWVKIFLISQSYSNLLGYHTVFILSSVNLPAVSYCALRSQSPHSIMVIFFSPECSIITIYHSLGVQNKKWKTKRKGPLKICNIVQKSRFSFSDKVTRMFYNRNNRTTESKR